MRPTIRQLTAAAAAVTGLVATLAATSTAAEAKTPAAQSFVMTFETVKGVDRPTHIAAVGPITGAGTETQTTQETETAELVEFTWHLTGGTVTADAVEQYDMVPNYEACTAKATGTGTWTIVSGTGVFAGARGAGTFIDHGRFVGARDGRGRCQPEAEPVLSVFILRGAGRVSLGGRA